MPSEELREAFALLFSWITNITLPRKTIMPVMRMGRSRWKIESEVFNTLKNQDYNFSHNFGHGEENLCTNFAYLMMLAFTVEQAQQRACKFPGYSETPENQAQAMGGR